MDLTWRLAISLWMEESYSFWVFIHEHGGSRGISHLFHLVRPHALIHTQLDQQRGQQAAPNGAQPTCHQAKLNAPSHTPPSSMCTYINGKQRPAQAVVGFFLPGRSCNCIWNHWNHAPSCCNSSGLSTRLESESDITSPL